MSTLRSDWTTPWLTELLGRCTFPARGTTAVCAVSGGADSLALLALACAAGLDATAVHVDHGLREGSAREAEIVAGAAVTLGASFRAESIQLEDGPDLEARARDARRQLLGPDVMTGHTADDQAETLLINLLRGAGVAGLAAMRPGHTHPILALRRSETEKVCVHLGFDPVIDPSNSDPRFLRNRIRHEVLPLLADVSDRDPVVPLNRAAERARASADSLAELAADIDPTDTRRLQAAPPELAAVALRSWLVDSSGHPPSSAEMSRVLEVVWHDRAACEISGGRRVARSQGRLRLEEAETEAASATSRRGADPESTEASTTAP